MDIDTVVLDHAVYCRGRGRKNQFTVRAGDPSGETVESLEMKEGCIFIKRAGKQIIIPLAQVLEIYPADATKEGIPRRRLGRPLGSKNKTTEQDPED